MPVPALFADRLALPAIAASLLALRNGGPLWRQAAATFEFETCEAVAETTAEGDEMRFAIAGILAVEIRGKAYPARLVTPPFVRHGKVCEGIL